MAGIARHVARALAALMLGPLGALAQVAPPPAAPTQAPPAQAAAPAPASASDALVFSTDVALVLHAIKPDKVADFESVMARLRVALQQSPAPTRAQQGAGWKVLKASEPGPAGSVLYVFVLDPVVKGADYTVSRILAEAFPDEIGVLWPKLRECYAGGLSRVSLAPLPATPLAPPGAATPRP